MCVWFSHHHILPECLSLCDAIAASQEIILEILR